MNRLHSFLSPFAVLAIALWLAGGTAWAQKIPSLMPTWPLLDAAKTGDIDKAKRAIISGEASPNQADGTDRTALMIASANGHLELVKVLLQMGAKPILRDRQGYTALHSAAENGNDEVVDVLIKAGAPVDANDRTGITPLMLATSASNVECVKLLLAAGADPELTDFGGRSVRERAELQRNRQVQRLIANAKRP